MTCLVEITFYPVHPQWFDWGPGQPSGDDQHCLYIVGGFLGYQWADFHCEFEVLKLWRFLFWALCRRWHSCVSTAWTAETYGPTRACRATAQINRTTTGNSPRSPLRQLQQQRRKRQNQHLPPSQHLDQLCSPFLTFRQSQWKRTHWKKVKQFYIIRLKSSPGISQALYSIRKRMTP